MKRSIVSSWLPLGVALSPVVVAMVIPMAREVRQPATATATSNEPTALELLSLRRAEPDQSQLVAAEHLRQRRADAQATVRTPFVQLQPVVEVAETTPAELQIPGLPQAHLSAILAGPRPVAVLNGRPLRVGQIFEDQWSVESIDAAEGSVVIAHLQEPERRFVVKLRRELPGG